MGVYVDALIDYGWELGPSCHLLADSEDELHDFAKSIGMKREWFQLGKNQLAHYDLTKRRRQMAISKGAIQITREQLYERLKQAKII